MGFLELGEGALGFLCIRDTTELSAPVSKGPGDEAEAQAQTHLAGAGGHGRVVSDGLVASLDAGVVLRHLIPDSALEIANLAVIGE